MTRTNMCKTLMKLDITSGNAWHFLPRQFLLLAHSPTKMQLYTLTQWKYVMISMAWFKKNVTQVR